jgi:SAM-dependent methyltransferase
VAAESDYDVIEGFKSAVSRIRKALLHDPPTVGAAVHLGDARKIALRGGAVDLVITSPPYLNAIDYLRGHRLALVWLGYDLATLRGIRANAIGAERAPDGCRTPGIVNAISDAITSSESVTRRHRKMVERYAFDLWRLLKEIRRVLRPTGRAVLVVGNSTLRGEFIRNSEGVKVAAVGAGLAFDSETARELPETRRYLPLAATANKSLGKRMRTESILRFVVA